MYQFFNCLPFDGPTKIIRRIKLMKKRDHQRRLSKGSRKNLNKTNLKSSDKNLNNKYNGDLIGDLNENQSVKLVSFTNLDKNIAPVDDKNNQLTNESKTELKTNFLNELTNVLKNEFKTDPTSDLKIEFFEIRQEASASKLNSTILDRIMEEVEEIDQKEEVLSLIEKTEILIKEEFTKPDDSKDEEINDKILHELHVHSTKTKPLVIQQLESPSNDLCTLVNKHVDDVCNNVEEMTNNVVQNAIHQNDNSQINEITTNSQIKSSTSASKLMDTAPIEFAKNLEINNQLIETTTTLDELDSERIINNNSTLINKSKISQSTTNLILNDNLTKNQLNESSNQNLTNSASPNALTKKLINQLSTEQLDDAKRANATKTNKKLIQDTDLRTNSILNGIETWIELNKGSNCALGIDLIDRTINDEKLFIIHEIIEKGIAETDQRLKIGDIILQVNDQPLKEMTCEEAMEHLNRTMGSVKLLIYRELICINDQFQSNENLNKSASNGLKINYSTKSTMHEIERDENVEQKVINDKLYEIIQVELQKKANKGLGLCIVNDNGKSPGPYISEILPNSVAHLEGRLKKGDHIVNVNGEDVTKSYGSTLSMLKCLQGLVTLKVARLMPGQVVFNSNQHQSVEPTSISFKVVTLNPKFKQKNSINRRISKPMNDRVKDLILTNDTDSVTEDFSLLNETVFNDWESRGIKPTNESTISKNWIRIDKSKASFDDETLNQQLANFNCQNLDELEKANKVLELNGQEFNSPSNGEKLIDKLKRSTSTVQMIVLN